MLIILECFFPCLQTVLKLQIYKSNGILKNKTATIFYTPGKICFLQGCILAGISFLSISSILLPTRKSGIRRAKYLSAAIFKEAVHSDDS